MTKDDFKIELDNNMLTISSQREDDNIEHDKRNYQRREYSYESFVRSFHLPDSAEVEKINAKYHDGILNMVIPKKEEAKRKPIKSIKIS